MLVILGLLLMLSNRPRTGKSRDNMREETTNNWNPLAYLGLIQPKERVQKALVNFLGGYSVHDPLKVTQPFPWPSLQELGHRPYLNTSFISLYFSFRHYLLLHNYPMCLCTCQQLLWTELPCNKERSQGDLGKRQKCLRKSLKRMSGPPEPLPRLLVFSFKSSSGQNMERRDVAS